MSTALVSKNRKRRFLPDVVYTTIDGTSAMLLFLLEPYVGKSLLPLFGGSTAVWKTSVFFFQVMVLAGYV